MKLTGFIEEVGRGASPAVQWQHLWNLRWEGEQQIWRHLLLLELDVFSSSLRWVQRWLLLLGGRCPSSFKLCISFYHLQNCIHAPQSNGERRPFLYVSLARQYGVQSRGALTIRSSCSKIPHLWTIFLELMSSKKSHCSHSKFSRCHEGFFSPVNELYKLDKVLASLRF